MRGSDGHQLAALFPAASHEKGERLGTANGGEGWSVVVIIENGAAAEQGTGDGEKTQIRVARGDSEDAVGSRCTGAHA
jgi:hypothetical protein